MEICSGRTSRSGRENASGMNRETQVPAPTYAWKYPSAISSSYALWIGIRETLSALASALVEGTR